MKAYRDEPCPICERVKAAAFGLILYGGPDGITCNTCYDAEAEINTGRVLVEVSA